MRSSPADGKAASTARFATRYPVKLRALPSWREAGYATLALPSSSPAYTRSFAEKLAAWQAIGEFLRANAPRR